MAEPLEVVDTNAVATRQGHKGRNALHANRTVRCDEDFYAANSRIRGAARRAQDGVVSYITKIVGMHAHRSDNLDPTPGDTPSLSRETCRIGSEFSRQRAAGQAAQISRNQFQPQTLVTFSLRAWTDLVVHMVAKRS